MSIRFTPGSPTDTDKKLHKWTKELQLVSPSALAAGAPLTLSEAYKVVYLSVTEIASGKLLDGVSTNNWRHLVLHGLHPQAELELNDALEPVALHEGPAKDGLQAALAAAENLGEDFEACVLQAAPLRFVGLWLRNEKQDWIMPFPPNMTALPNFSLTSVADAMAVLQPLALDILHSSTAANPTGG
jgi:hypothetical protein